MFLRVNAYSVQYGMRSGMPKDIVINTHNIEIYESGSYHMTHIRFISGVEYMIDIPFNQFDDLIRTDINSVYKF